MNPEIKARLNWVTLYQEIGNAGIVCRRCGISRPTFRKWWKRYLANGIAGLEEHSRRPHSSPNRKVTVKEEELILLLRVKRNLGARRTQTELKRLHNLELSLGTIHKVFKKHHVKPIKRYRRKADYIRYERPIPGDRVQMDTCKIRPGLYQYTAIDDCTRYRVLGLYSRRTAANTILFLERVVEEMPFPIQRIQTDRGTEFFAIIVQKKLKEYGIKFRPNKPGSPHLNGKVERSQKTDKEEFYPTLDFDHDDLQEKLDEWQHYYNWFRPHGAHNGKSPMDKYSELSEKTPFWDEVHEDYYPENEPMQNQNYKEELKLRKLKRSL